MKLFVSDLDGTLLNSEHELPEHSKDTLKRAMAMNIPVCIATGRSYRDILQIFSDFEEKKLQVIYYIKLSTFQAIQYCGDN